MWQHPWCFLPCVFLSGGLWRWRSRPARLDGFWGGLVASGDRTPWIQWSFSSIFFYSLSSFWRLFFSSFSDGGEYAMRMDCVKCDIASLSTEKLQFLWDSCLNLGWELFLVNAAGQTIIPMSSCPKDSVLSFMGWGFFQDLSCCELPHFYVLRDCPERGRLRGFKWKWRCWYRGIRGWCVCSGAGLFVNWSQMSWGNGKWWWLFCHCVFAVLFFPLVFFSWVKRMRVGRSSGVS